MAGDGYDVRPEVLRGASIATRDDAERVRRVAATAANAMLGAVTAAGAGPLAGTLDRLRDDVTGVLASAGAEIGQDADRLATSATDYETGDAAAAADAIRRVLTPGESRS